MKNKQRFILDILALRSVEVGTVVSKDQYEAIQNILGETFKKMPEPQVIADIRFTETGKPIVVKGADNATIEEL